MKISARQFASDLYDEHIEEAAFLYELVRTSVRESDFRWVEVHDFEVRREAHIDALSIGGSAALAQCLDVAADGAGELYVYASAILRQGRANEFGGRISDLTLDDADSLIALTAAISEHADPTQLNYLSTANFNACCSVTLIAIDRACEQVNHSTTNDALKQALLARWNDLRLVLPEHVEAMGELDDLDSYMLFGTVADNRFHQAHLLGATSDNDFVKVESMLNILRYGQTLDKDELKQHLKAGEHGHAAIMIGAGANYAHHLMQNMESVVSEDAIQALALSGLPEVVRIIVKALDSDYAETAATALYCVTGAELLENVFEEDAIVEDELFEDERAAYEAGNKPRRLDGEAFGEERSRISIDPERWKQWLVSNRAQFVTGTRYRFGEPITPDSLVRTLRREQSPLWIREYTEKELRIRYGVSAPFNISLPVQVQIRNLLAMRHAVSALQSTSPGKWYIDGGLMSQGS